MFIITKTGLKKIPILEMFGKDGEQLPNILLVVARGDERIPRKYKGYPTFYCLVLVKPSSVSDGFELGVVHIPSNTVLYLDEKTEVFE